MKKLCIFFFCVHACMYGQKGYNNNFYAFRPYSYNAAYAGWTEGLSVYLQFAGQNSGLPTSPKTTNFFLTKGVHTYGGVGLRAFVDERGIFKTTRVTVEAAYAAVFDPISLHILRLGVSGGGHWERLNLTAIERRGHIDLDDPVLYDRREMDLQFGGAFAYQLYGFELGVSAPFLFSLYEDRYKILDQLSYALSYTFLFNLDTWKIKPMFIGQSFSAGLHLYDAIVLLDWDERFWWHIGYRSNQSILGAVGIGAKGFTVGYSAELPFGSYSTIAGLAHTVMISFVAGEKYFTKRKKKKKGYFPGKGKKNASEEAESP